MFKLSYVSNEHSTALMKWLSISTQKLGREVAENTYVVGGAIRNFKLNVPVKDVDLVLDSVALGKDSEWVAERLARMIPARTETVSDQYGVAKIFVKSEWIVDGVDLSEFSANGDAAIEIVNARSETYSDDTGGGYKPTTTKSTIREDIFRRDFTFNTLMWRLADLANGPDKAEIIDITGCGLADLEAGEARCPLDPVKTFYDDPTRILRAIKFLVKYNLKIPKDTAQAIMKTRRALLKISADRVFPEIKNILNEKSWEKVLTSFEELGLIDVLKEIAETNESFRSALSSQAKKLPYMFFIKLLNMGIKVRHDISFLTRNQMQRMEELSRHLDLEDQSDLVRALKSPGSAIKDKRFLPNLAQEEGVKGKAIRDFMALKMEQLREMYLEDPEIIYNPTEIKRRVKTMIKNKIASIKRVVAKYERLKATQKMKVYHATTFERAVKMMNGFDALEVRRREFNTGKHRGLFVSPKPAMQFGGVVLELEVYAKFLHGTDWGGNIGRVRQDQKANRYHDGYFEEIKEDYPDSFRPSLSESLERKYEPQALYLGLVKPSQIKRVCHGGAWMSRSEFIALGEVEGSYAQKNRLKDVGFDLSSPNHSLEDVYEFIASYKNTDVNGVKKTFKRFVSRWEEQRYEKVILDTLSKLGFGGLATIKYTDMIIQDLK